MKDQELTQTDAAHRLGIEQPDVSKRLRGHFRQFLGGTIDAFLWWHSVRTWKLWSRPASATRARTKAAQLTVTAKSMTEVIGQRAQDGAPRQFHLLRSRKMTLLSQARGMKMNAYSLELCARFAGIDAELLCLVEHELATGVLLTY